MLVNPSVVGRCPVVCVLLLHDNYYRQYNKSKDIPVTDLGDL
jgi:hypothetical protein